MSNHIQLSILPNVDRSYEWQPYEDVKPPTGELVLAYSEFWISQDESEGIRIGFQNENAKGPFISGRWCDYHDTWETMTTEKATDGKPPQYWRHLPPAPVLL